MWPRSASCTTRHRNDPRAMSTPGYTLGTGPAAALAAVAAPPSAAAHARRIASIDVMRGLVMVVMARPRARDVLPAHAGGRPDGCRDDRARALLHAPRRAFLRADLRLPHGPGRLAVREPAAATPRRPAVSCSSAACCCVVLELTVVSFAWTGDMPLKTLYLQVIWAIGLQHGRAGPVSTACRVLLAPVGLVIVFGHNLLTPHRLQPGHRLPLWTILHDRASWWPKAR